jgi:hypothetical protein
MARKLTVIAVWGAQVRSEPTLHKIFHLGGGWWTDTETDANP